MWKWGAALYIDVAIFALTFRHRRSARSYAGSLVEVLLLTIHYALHRRGLPMELLLIAALGPALPLSRSWSFFDFLRVCMV